MKKRAVSTYYLEKVTERALRLFRQYRDVLPNEPFEIEVAWEEPHRTRVIVFVHETPTGHWVCDEALMEIINELNRYFEGDRTYAGVELDVSADWADGVGAHFRPAGQWGSRFRVTRSDQGRGRSG